MSDTMFPNISVMRYRLNFWRVVDDWVVTVEASDQDPFRVDAASHSFTVMAGELKQHDLLHLLQAALQEVAASTP